MLPCRHNVFDLGGYLCSAAWSVVCCREQFTSTRPAIGRGSSAGSTAPAGRVQERSAECGLGLLLAGSPPIHTPWALQLLSHEDRCLGGLRAGGTATLCCPPRPVPPVLGINSLNQEDLPASSSPAQGESQDQSPHACVISSLPLPGLRHKHLFWKFCSVGLEHRFACDAHRASPGHSWLIFIPCAGEGGPFMLSSTTQGPSTGGPGNGADCSLCTVFQGTEPHTQ